MKLGSDPKPCSFCTRPIMVARVRGGAFHPFELAMVPNEPAAVDAYVPMRSGDVLALVPLGEVADRHLAAVRWLARRHRCAEFFRAARKSSSDQVDPLAAAISQWVASITEQRSTA